MQSPSTLPYTQTQRRHQLLLSSVKRVFPPSGWSWADSLHSGVAEVSLGGCELSAQSPTEEADLRLTGSLEQSLEHRVSQGGWGQGARGWSWDISENRSRESWAQKTVLTPGLLGWRWGWVGGEQCGYQPWLFCGYPRRGGSERFFLRVVKCP